MNRRVESESPKSLQETLVGRPKYRTEKTGESEVSPLVYTAMEEMVAQAEEMKQKVESGDLTPEQAASDVFGALNKKSAELKKLEGAKGRGWHPAIKGVEDDPNPLYTLWGEMKQRVRDEEEEEEEAIEVEDEDILETEEPAKIIEPPPLPTDSAEMKDKEKEQDVRETIKQMPAAKRDKRPRIKVEKKTGGPFGGTTTTFHAQRRKKGEKTGLSFKEKPIEKAEDLHMLLQLDYGNAVKIKPDGTVKKGWFGKNERAFTALYTSDKKFREMFDDFQERLWLDQHGVDTGDEKFVLGQVEKINLWNQMNEKEKAEAKTILDLYEAEDEARVQEYVQNAMDGRVPKRIVDYLSDIISEDELFGADEQVVEAGEDVDKAGAPLSESLTEEGKEDEKKAA